MKATKKFSLRRIVRWERDFSQIFVRIALPIAIQNMVAASAHIVDGLITMEGYNVRKLHRAKLYITADAELPLMQISGIFKRVFDLLQIVFLPRCSENI